MNRLSRRQVLGGAAAAAAAAALRAPSVHAQKNSKTLRFVAEADLKILDPVWQNRLHHAQPRLPWQYDTLAGTDENSRIKPQMVDRTTVSPDGMKYTFTLRDDLRWHDGAAGPVGRLCGVAEALGRRIASASSSWRTRGRSRL
jgi:peptide/nickel transport system substrate-binding protein